ncbi:hypothetical protein CO683_41115 [Bradyrhizobium ottawaense]|nr:hypothetical protein [Bradyrhizobium sp. CCBAU 45394]MDA9489459.1 hypothetical protein [Bradyrhizobium sp. CCBAU 11361]PDT63977.1 hypothetical protein CO683_41115 [Bradyrhizobium ottawaense]
MGGAVECKSDKQDGGAGRWSKAATENVNKKVVINLNSAGEGTTCVVEAPSQIVDLAEIRTVIGI